MTIAPEQVDSPPETAGRRVPVSLVVCAALVGLAVLSAVSAATVVVSPLGPVAVAVGLLLGASIWARPLVGVVVVAAVAPALAGLSRGIGLPGLKLSELLVVVAAVAIFLRRPPRWRRTVGVDFAMAGFAVTSLGFGIFHVTQGTIPLLIGSNLGEAFLVTVQPGFLFLAWWAGSRGVQSSADVPVVLRWVLLVSMVPAIVAVMQYLDLPGVRDALVAVTGNAGLLIEEGADAASDESSVLRVTGPFTIWHSLGGYLLIPAVLSTVLLLRRDRSVLSMPLLGVVLLVDAAALVLTVTVTLLLWLPVAVLVSALLARRLFRAVGVLAVLAVAALLVFPEAIADRAEQQTSSTASTAGVAGADVGALQTLQYRIVIWQRDYLPVVSNAAPVGLGTEKVDSALFASTENQLLTYVLRGGIGLVAMAYVAMGALAWRAFRHSWAPANPARSGALALVGVMSFLPAASMVWPYISNAGLSYALVAIAGAVLALEPAQDVPAPVRGARKGAHRLALPRIR